MNPVDYPNVLRDIVVVEYSATGRVGLSVRPIEPGLYRIMVWPKGLADPDLYRHSLVEFLTAVEGPRKVEMDLTDIRWRSFKLWEWAIVPTNEERLPIEDLARFLYGEEHFQKGTFRVHTHSRQMEAKGIIWSCHMPYKTVNGRAEMNDPSMNILKWYHDETLKFKPDFILGGGDTGYSDGTGATNFVKHVYDKGSWHQNPEIVSWLKREYRKMYLHFWSLDPLRKIMSSFPHLFIWDDHEIRDGWGSEGNDFRGDNQEMFRIAKEIAEEFILNSGPRMRRSGAEAHQSFILGPLALFVFDTRSTRNYESKDEKLISTQQFDDFLHFLEEVKTDSNVTHLITNTSVPFVGLRSWVTKLITRAPDFLNDKLLKGVRDDVRDSWTSPGNLPTLTKVLRALTRFQYSRSDVKVINVSGDIHVAQAYSIIIPGSIAPIYQVTTSALTNRTHPSEFLAALIEVARDEIVEGVGLVQRIWKTVSEPNFLTFDIVNGKIKFQLKVFNKDDPGKDDLELSI